MTKKKTLTLGGNPTPSEYLNQGGGATNDRSQAHPKLVSPILKKVREEQWSEILAIEFYRKKTNSRGVFCGLEPAEFEDSDGKPQRQLTVWAELSDEDLGNLFGRGDYRVCCRGATKPVCWVNIELDGPDPESINPRGGPPGANGARGRSSGPIDDDDPRNSATTGSVSWAFGTLVDPTDLPAAMRPYWLTMQEHAITEHMRYEDNIRTVRADADARVRMSERFALTTIQLCESRVKEAQLYSERVSEMLKNFTALQCELATANGGGYSDGKFIARLFQDERATVAKLAQRLERLKDQVREAESKKKPATADTVLAFKELAAELRRTMRQFGMTWQGIGNDDEDDEDDDGDERGTVEGSAEPADKARADRARAVDEVGPR